MLYKNVELHNVAETMPHSSGGVLLQRVPESVRGFLNEAAQMRMRQPDNCEIRFVLGSGPARVTLSSEGHCDVTLFYGLFDGRQRFTLTPEPQTIEIAAPERLSELGTEYTEGMAFSPKVCRLILGGRNREPAILHGAEGEGLRPPEPGELPKLRYLAYGTSITHGFDAEGPHLTYVGWTARRLGADLINLGVGGAAHCELELADYIGARKDWDIASLALSVNMQGFAMDEFSRRVSHMVNAVSGADTSRPVACITLYPYSRDFGVDAAGAQYGGTPGEYRQALRDAAANCPHPNLHLLEGPEILTDMTGLTLDLVHPGDYGMAEMGQRLSTKLAQLLEG